MVIVGLVGGLGNQMFEYALYTSLRERGVDCAIDDVSIHKDNFGLRKPELGRAFGIDYIRCPEKELINEGNKKYHYRGHNDRRDDDYLIYLWLRYFSRLYRKRNIHLFSFFQNVRIFGSPEAEAKLRSDFKCTDERKNRPAFKKWAKEINNSPSASFHIRKTDYEKGNNAKKYGNICTEAYYKKAMNLMLEKEPGTIFYLFSDDKEYIKEHFKGDRFVVVDDKELDDIDEFFLMSECRNHIMANSTYSWWATWLGNNPDAIIIAPEKWIHKKINPNLTTDRMTVVSKKGEIIRKAKL